MKHKKRKWSKEYTPVAPKTYGDERLNLKSWGDVRIPLWTGETDSNGAIQKTYYGMDDLRLDDEVREELSGPYGDFQFRVLDILPRPVIIVYEDGEEPMELARWVKTYMTNMKAISEGWDDARTQKALPQKFMFYLPDTVSVATAGNFFRYLEEGAMEYRAAFLMPRMWSAKGRRRLNPQGYTMYTRNGADRPFYSPWRPWPYNANDSTPRTGVWAGGKPMTGNPATLGIEFMDPQEALDLATEMEKAQLGAMSWEWYDLGAAEKKRTRNGHTKKLKSPAILAVEGLDQAFRALNRMDEDDVDRILETWIPRFKKLSLIKARPRQGDQSEV